MASAILPKSIQRTDSTGQLNVFILFKKKTNGDLIIVSREDLSPALRSGRLVLNQKIIIRDEERNSIEGSILYMHGDRDTCVAYKQHLLENRSQLTNQCNANSSCSKSNTGSSSNAVIRKQANHIPNKPVARPTTKQTTVPKNNLNKKPIPLQSKTSCEFENDNDNSFNDQQPTLDDNSNDVMSSNTTLNEQKIYSTSVGQTLNACITVEDDTDNHVFINKINELSLKLLEQKQLLKNYENQIKRLHETMIEIPTDQATRDYICHLSDKIREMTIGHKYTGNLTKDAKSLGISTNELNDMLNIKAEISTIARKIFKRMIPVNIRIAGRWNDLPKEVLLKEEILLNFLQSYFGSLKANHDKLHKSLVGCFRNERGKKNTLQQQGQMVEMINDDTFEEVNGMIDDNDENFDV